MKLLYMSSIISVIVSVKAEEVSYNTTSDSIGHCVPLKHCFDLLTLNELTTDHTPNAVNDLKQAECELPDKSKGVFCQPNRVFELPSNCGVSSVDRITAAFETNVFEFPWMALLMFRNRQTDELKGYCDGSLISDRYILTSAHCFADDERFNLDHVRLGEHKTDESDCKHYPDVDGKAERFCDIPVEKIGIESIVVHPQYNDSPFSNDIALIRLSKKVTFKSHIQPICLPMNIDMKNRSFTDYTVVSWDRTMQHKTGIRLLKGRTPRMDSVECQDRFEQIRGNLLNVTITEKHICTGAGYRVDGCRSNSGGPLMNEVFYNGRPRFVQFGMTFTIRFCSLNNFPTVNIHVGSYLGWILANMTA